MYIVKIMHVQIMESINYTLLLYHIPITLTNYTYNVIECTITIVLIINPSQV